MREMRRRRTLRFHAELCVRSLRVGLLACGFEGLEPLIATFQPSPSSTKLEWQSGRQLPTYSGGTAPASHRLPFYAPTGTRSDQQIFRTADLSLPTTNVKLDPGCDSGHKTATPEGRVRS